MGALLAVHDTIGLGATLDVLDALLAVIKTIGFALIQSARGSALIDAALLVCLVLVDARRIGLGENNRRNDGDKCGKNVAGFHDSPP
jgi:hypothetical protein